jgi:hypothetical protein
MLDSCRRPLDRIRRDEDPDDYRRHTPHHDWRRAINARVGTLFHFLKKYLAVIHSQQKESEGKIFFPSSTG